MGARCITPNAQDLLLHVTGADRPTPSCLLVTAAAGYGKSALLETLRPEGGIVTTGLALIADGPPEGAPWIGVDDIDRLGADDAARLVGLLPAGADVALASRAPICGAVRAALGGRLSEWDATDLALAPYAAARVLAQESGVTDPEAALRVAELTCGWPMLVHFAADALARDAGADLVAALTETDAPAGAWIRSSVLAALPAGAQELLRVVATVGGTGPVTQAGCDAVADHGGLHRVPGVVEAMRHAGLLVPSRRVGRTAEVVLVPVVALILRGAADVRASRRTAAVATSLARVHEAQCAWLPAARAHAVAGDRARVVRIVADRGEDMLRRGDARPVARLVEQIVAGGLDAEPDLLRQTYADALRMSGDTVGARRAFAPLVALADAAGWSPGLAARVAGLHYLCGEFESALDVLNRCTDVAEPVVDRRDGDDLVDWLACRVHVLAMLGRPDDAQAAAARCLEAAERLGDARSLAVAHLAVARTCRGTRKDLHHGQSIRYATEAGDAITATRALAAQTCLLLAAARYDLAAVSAREAARLARLACPPGLQAAALHNLGEALRRTGELDEALWHLECSVVLCRTQGLVEVRVGSGRHGRGAPVAGACGAESHRLHRGRGARPRVR